MTEEEIIAALSAPFPPERISWRVGRANAEKTRGMALAYIDARDVMERLDQVIGPFGWQNRYPHAEGKTVCEIGIQMDGQWIWKADGAGDTDFEAEKGALSDAFKRAAVRWGIGRYLYDIEAPWVAVEAHGKSVAIKESELPKLASLLTGKKQETKKDTENKIDLAAQKKADNLIKQIRDSKTISDLDDLVRQREFTTALNSLPTTEKARVVTNGTTKRSLLGVKVEPLNDELPAHAR